MKQPITSANRNDAAFAAKPDLALYAGDPLKKSLLFKGLGYSNILRGKTQIAVGVSALLFEQPAPEHIKHYVLGAL